MVSLLILLWQRRRAHQPHLQPSFPFPHYVYHCIYVGILVLSLIFLFLLLFLLRPFHHLVYISLFFFQSSTHFYTLISDIQPSYKKSPEFKLNQKILPSSFGFYSSPPTIVQHSAFFLFFFFSSRISSVAISAGYMSTLNFSKMKISFVMVKTIISKNLVSSNTNILKLLVFF